MFLSCAAYENEICGVVSLIIFFIFLRIISGKDETKFFR